MKSPDNQFEVAQSNYDEVRMGSPLFGELEIKGSSFGFVAGQFAELIAFSPDSRFLAAAELTATIPNPMSQVIVFDFERSIRIVVHTFPGFARRFVWEKDGTLTAITWSIIGGEETCRLSIPPVHPRPKKYWLDRLFE